MSFQHFRLGDISLHPSISHSQHVPPTVTTTKQPYGSGDSDDGYTLVFPNLDAFQAWRVAEEDRNCVEFVKGDTHGSKADPPRFKDHTKLVCARHSRSGRKKYIKKHPERVRKVPSRKLDGVGCQASISYKTYFDTEEVRVCYVSQHSHEIGPANLPYTRRGRKAAVLAEKDRGKKSLSEPQSTPGPSSQAGPSTGVMSSPPAQAPQQAQSVNSFTNAVSMLAPLPAQSFQSQAPQPYYPAQPIQNFAQPPPQNLPHERWENMATLFQTVREHARAFEYPAASVAALETVLIRLYLESPIGIAQQQQQSSLGAMLQNGLSHTRGQTNGHQNGVMNDGGNSSTDDAS